MNRNAIILALSVAVLTVLAPTTNGKETGLVLNDVEEFSESEIANCWVCDFDKSGESLGVIDIADLAVFANQWLNPFCENDYLCQMVDLDFSNTVDFYDFALFAKCFNEKDTTAPVNVEWRKYPYARGTVAPENTEVRMYALDADDLENNLPITYLFIRYEADGSGVYGVTGSTSPFDAQQFDIEDVRYNDTYWSTSPVFTDDGLIPGQTYQYHFYARDSAGNVAPVLDGLGEFAILTVVTGVDVLDNTPPTPDPMTWITLPTAYTLNSFRWNYMAAMSNGYGRDVEYQFDCSNNYLSSGWRASHDWRDGFLVEKLYIDDEYLDGIPGDDDTHPANVYIRIVSPSGTHSWRVRARAVIRDNQGEVFPESQTERTTDWSLAVRVN